MSGYSECFNSSRNRNNGLVGSVKLFVKLVSLNKSFEMTLRKMNKEFIYITVYVLLFYQIGMAAYGYPQGNYNQRPIRRSDDFPNSYYNQLTTKTYSNRRSDDINAKFVGADNQEEERTFHRLNRFNRHRFQHNRPHHSHNPCRGRSANEEGRFFWDLNVYNLFPNQHQNYNNDRPQSQQPSYDCGGGGGGGGYYDDNRPPNRPLFSIPIYRPPNNRPAFSNNNGGGSNQNQNDASGNNQNQNNGDVFDPVNDERPVNENIPNDNPAPMQLFLTPGQAVGGIASTVNNVIQTLTGSNRPGRGQAGQTQADPVNTQSLAPGDIFGGLSNTVNSVIQTLSGNGRNGAFLNALYSGFNLF